MKPTGHLKRCLVLSVATIGMCTSSRDLTHPVNQNIIDEINQKATTWRPMEIVDNPLSKRSAAQVYGLLGTIVDSSKIKSKSEIL